MNITTALSLVAWEVAKKCGVEVDQKKVDLAFDYLRKSTTKDGADPKNTLTTPTPITSSPFAGVLLVSMSLEMKKQSAT